MTATKTAPKRTSQEEIQAHVMAVAEWIDKLAGGEVTENHYEDVYEELYESVYDVNYTLGQDREQIGVRVMVAGGGPTIWIDSRYGVEGYWSGDEARRQISDDARDMLNEAFPFEV